MTKGKRILVISPFEKWPLSQGAISRAHHLTRYLTQYNEVWYAFRGKKNAETILAGQRMIANSSDRASQLFNLRFLWRLYRIIRQEHIELIMVTHFWAALHGILLKFITTTPLVIDTHNVEYLRFRRMGSPIWPVVSFAEFIAYRVADSILCVSEIDRSLLVARLHVPGGKIQIVPNGAAIADLTKHQIDCAQVRRAIGLGAEEAMILFFGSLLYRANVQAVDVILDEVAPRLTRLTAGWKIVVVGLGQAEYLQVRRQPLPPNVIFTGFVDDIAAVVKCAQVVIVPILSGSGTRFKIIESVALGKRVISTGIGAEGLDRSVFGDSLTIRDDWDSFADQIVQSLNEEPDLELNPDFVAQYDWDLIFGRMELLGSAADGGE